MKKKSLIIVSVLSILFSSIAGCASVPNLVYSEVTTEKINRRVAKFIADYEDSNGVYIFYYNEKDIYLLLNNKNVKQGDEAAFYKDIMIEDKGDTIAISFNEYYIKDYSSVVKNKLIYRIKTIKDFDYIKVYKNGEETYINVVGS